jgi:hypothetical protein
MTLIQFIAMVVITVYPWCNSNTLNVIAIDMLQSFKMFIVTMIKILQFKMFLKISAIAGHVKF